MKTIEEIKVIIQEEVKNTLGILIPVDISKTTFGQSMYIQVIGMGKIRISDHSVTNMDRMWNETHYQLNTVENNIDSLILHVEKLYFPERFETKIIEVLDYNYKTRPCVSVEHFIESDLLKNKIIVNTEFFIKKNGESRVQITWKEPVIYNEKIKVRK